VYGPGARFFQDQFDARRLADRVEQRLVRDHLEADDRAFVESLDMLFIASVDAEGRPTCGYRGGDPGFVRVLDERTLAFPNYDGNGMFLTLGNVRETRAIGLLFIDFERQKRLRIAGNAEVLTDDPLLAEHPEAQCIVRVAVTQVFPNCPRYVHKRVLVERSKFVPKAGATTPDPGWKSADWASDVLPKKR
jgi:predicted pyridoxine 5'-phosphate oxidase superfamily flavin-nucleotide-binding protein